MRRTWWVPLALLLVACGESTPDEQQLIGWLGAEPHFVVAGSLNGEDFAIELTPEQASDLSKLACQREYDVPVDPVSGELDWANGSFDEIRINLSLEVNGEQRDLQIELKRHAFAEDTLPTVLTIVPRVDTLEPGPQELWFEWEWYRAGDLAADLDPYYEAAAQSGTVQFELFTGEIGSTGLMIPDNEGSVGVFLEAVWSESESLKMSVTAPCGPNEL